MIFHLDNIQYVASSRKMTLSRAAVCLAVASVFLQALPTALFQQVTSGYDQCQGNPCLNWATCIDGVGKYTCVCVSDYEGKRCETNECEPNPCQNGGTCTYDINDFNCTCVPGYSGKNCDVDIDECRDNPCGQGTCSNTDGSFSCDCTGTGYKGELCDEVVIPYDCNFEKGLCSWTQDTTDQFDWTRHQGPTLSADTGPITDHTTGTDEGYYMYMEASSPRQFNDSARLLSPTITPGLHCFRFYYYMYDTRYGSDVYQLNAYVMEGATKTQIFSKQGDLGQAWLEASIPVSRTQNYQLVLEAVRGKSWQGDIAVDDVTVAAGPCTELDPSSGN